MKELNLKDLTTRQKLGLCMTAHIYRESEWPADWETNTEYALDMIRNHALGAVWVDPSLPDLKEVMEEIKSTADYPILILTDAENGIGGHYIGRHNPIGCTDNEELAYIFGKVTAATARKMGYNVICDPVVDMTRQNSVCGGTTRSLGGDKHKVALLAAAEVRGLHDGGVLSVAKHYPSAGRSDIDSHMAENLAEETKEELLDYNLFPYLSLMKEGLLDGIMTAHSRLPNIDPDYPASLSEKVIGIIREQGFDGFAITDALVMMGVVAKFGNIDSKGLAIANGNELALTWGPNQDGFEAILASYDKGLIPDSRLDEAVRRVLEAQHKTTLLPDAVELTDEELEKFQRINKESTYAVLDKGLKEAISRDGRHYFVVMTENSVQLDNEGQINVDTMQIDWYDPQKIMAQLSALFPNSATCAINEFPTAMQNLRVLEQSVGYDDVVFITFINSQAYVGRECLTGRIVSLIQALQITNRVSSLVHFGNPFVLEELEHIPRILVGGLSAKNVEHTLEILAGMHPAKGVPTYDVKLK